MFREWRFSFWLSSSSSNASSRLFFLLNYTRYILLFRLLNSSINYTFYYYYYYFSLTKTSSTFSCPINYSTRKDSNKLRIIVKKVSQMLLWTLLLKFISHEKVEFVKFVLEFSKIFFSLPLIDSVSCNGISYRNKSLMIAALNRMGV